jgi:thioesterase domain-containing protein
VPFLFDRVVSLCRHGFRRLRSFVYVLRNLVYKMLSRPLPTDETNRKHNLRIARRRYRPKTFKGKAILFRAGAKPLTSDYRYADWPSMVTGGLEVHFVPGQHASILKSPNVQTLAGILNTYLASFDADG